MNAKTFSELFKKYRLQSSIPSLVDLSNKLIDENIYYDYSIYSKWQSGQRIPRERKTIIALIKIFIKNEGLNHISDANDLLASANCRDLTENEIKNIFSKFTNSHNNLPIDTMTIERTRELKIILWEIMNCKNVLIHGLSGIGKTTLAIKAGYLINEKYSKNVFWFNIDNFTVENIIHYISIFFNENYSQISNLDVKLNKVKDLLSKSKSLLILDNIPTLEILNIFNPRKNDQYQIIVTSIKNIRCNDYYKIKLNKFNKKEALNLANSILGQLFINLNKSKINKIFYLTDYHPFTLSVCFKYISKNPTFLDKLINDLSNFNFKFKDKYDNKNIISSLNSIFLNLNIEERKVFLSLRVFIGKIFFIKMVAYINEFSIKKTTHIINNLLSQSLITKFSNGRCTIHPLIINYLQLQKPEKKLFTISLEYYLNIISKHKNSFINKYKYIDQDYENIIFIYKKNLFYKNNYLTYSFWNYLNLYMQDRGLWKEKIDLIQEIIHFKENHNFELLSKVYADLGWIYFWQNKIEMANTAYQKSLKYSTLPEKTLQFYITNQKQALIFLYKKDKQNANRLLLESLKYFKKNHLNNEVYNTYLYLGHTYKKDKKYHVAIKYYKKSFYVAKKNKDLTHMAIAQHYLGMVYLFLKNFKIAKIYLNKSLKIDLSYNRKSGIAWCLYGLAIANRKNGKNSLSDNLLKKSSSLFMELNMNFQVKKINKLLRTKQFFVPDNFI